MIRLAMLVSGGGTTAEQVYRACCSDGILHGLVKPVVLVGSADGIGAFERLKRAGFTGCRRVCSRKGVTEDAFAESLLEVFDTNAIDWFGQYGWIPKTPAIVTEKYKGINQHPQLTPHFGGEGFYGLTPHAAALLYGCMTDHLTSFPVAQLVAPEYDQGSILATLSVPIDPADTPETLQDRVLRYEWLVQITALLRIANYNGEVPPAIDSPVIVQSEDQKSCLSKARQRALDVYSG